MKIPETFVPEKSLEDKIERLGEGYVSQGRNVTPKIEKKDINDLLKNICSVRDYEVFSEIRPLLEKTGYTLMKSKKRYEYWSRPAGLDEKHLFIRIKDKTEHYAFSTVEENNLEKFCKKFEYGKKQAPLNVILTVATTAVTTLSGMTAFAFLYETGRVSVGLYGVALFAFSGIVLGTYLAERLKKKNKNLTKRYCLNLIRDDQEALKAAFS
ncbi:hypothetical protein FJZ53_01160 [Candidatus Woesearchaeota archaeon]|nr:hypothetical protein [Candidatus Woesearchaeota archaeon]